MGPRRLTSMLSNAFQRKHDQFGPVGKVTLDPSRSVGVLWFGLQESTIAKMMKSWIIVFLVFFICAFHFVIYFIQLAWGPNQAIVEVSKVVSFLGMVCVT